MSDTDNSDEVVTAEAGQPAANTGSSKVELRVINPNHHVFREGEVGDMAFIVRTGTIEVYKMTDTGELILGTVGKGGMFGEMALIDNQPRMASARAKDEDVELMVITRQMLEKKLDGMDPFIKALVNIMTSHIRKLAKSLSDSNVSVS
jgi:CRP/FNR family transcriptional regulator, cyclic AMP receptor protein